MVDVVVFVEYLCLVLWVDRLAINLPSIEYGFVISISSWRLRLRSGPESQCQIFHCLTKKCHFSRCC